MHSHSVTFTHKGRDLSRGLCLWLQRARQRRQLAELPPWRLADIGISEAERRRECAKWFWEK
ncbi:DUF1127 domain-containing protein [Afifella pfennigii]|uniref:DUF1127 domain-containing protein n=1 Tax=Afifella pfennigii TaxID=209897 RepID=UPI00047D06C3|nr:DUF1127 domain-containing protein [Afifella pfennigii]